MNTMKTTFLMGLLFGIFMLIGGVVGGSYGVVTAFVLAGAMNFFMYWFSDSIVLATYGAKEISESEAPEIHRIVASCAVAAGIPKPRVYITQVDVPNAFATGRNPQRGVVAVTRGLLSLLDMKEVEGVIAHEIGHIKNRDTLISTIAATAAGAIMMIASMARWAAIFGIGRSDDDGPGIVELLILAVVAPFAAMMIQMAISRSREFLADETAASLTHNPLGLADALTKIQGYASNYPLHGGNMATSHLFIINPFSGAKMASLFSTHPPTEERIKRLRALAGR